MNLVHYSICCQYNYPKCVNGTTKTDKISLNSEISDDGRMISTIEIIITKISN